MWKTADRCCGATWQSRSAARPTVPVHMFTRSAQFGITSHRRKSCWYSVHLSRLISSVFRCILTHCRPDTLFLCFNCVTNLCCDSLVTNDWMRCWWWVMTSFNRCSVFTEQVAAESYCWSDDWSAVDGSGAEFEHVVVDRRHNGRIRKWVYSHNTSSKREQSLSNYTELMIGIG